MLFFFLEGTSLEVGGSVFEILKGLRDNEAIVPQILINKNLIVKQKLNRHGVFDVSLLGPCDDILRFLCQQLQWSISVDGENQLPIPTNDLSKMEFEMTQDRVFQYQTAKMETKVRIKRPRSDAKGSTAALQVYVPTQAPLDLERNAKKKTQAASSGSKKTKIQKKSK